MISRLNSQVSGVVVIPVAANVVILVVVLCCAVLCCAMLCCAVLMRVAYDGFGFDLRVSGKRAGGGGDAGGALRDQADGLLRLLLLREEQPATRKRITHTQEKGRDER